MTIKSYRDFKTAKKAYYTGSREKEEKETLTTGVSKLIREGILNGSLHVTYDLSVEKYRTSGQDSLTHTLYDKDKSIKLLLKQAYGEFLPKNAIDLISPSEVIFHPHKPVSYEQDGKKYSNLFIKSKILSFDTREHRINQIEWEKYPNIKPLFANVFKTVNRMNYFVNWLAYGFQTLSKTRTAIISKGIQGTGKGVIFELIIQYAIGANYTTILDNEALKSRFNGDLENKMFVLANEIKADSREGNSTYERMKMYISDSNIRFEDKNVKARVIPNFFNMWLHSNNNVPLQIQGSDRRYTVMDTQSKKLDTVSQELGHEHISYYIEAIKKERDDFLFDLMALNYDTQKATTPMITEEKELIYESSMSKIEVMTDKLKDGNIDYFTDALGDFFENDDTPEKLRQIKRDYPNLEAIVTDIRKSILGNYISNSLSFALYKVLVFENDSDRAIGLRLNAHFGKAKVSRIGGDTLRYRLINSDKEATFPLPQDKSKKEYYSEENKEEKGQQVIPFEKKEVC